MAFTRNNKKIQSHIIRFNGPEGEIESKVRFPKQKFWDKLISKPFVGNSFRLFATEKRTEYQMHGGICGLSDTLKECSMDIENMNTLYYSQNLELSAGMKGDL